MTDTANTNGAQCGCLTPEQLRILREHGTERPGSSPLNSEKRAGEYRCAGCGTPLFRSGAKYESGSGWPSFFEAIPGGVGTTTDTSHGMTRTEVHCAHCHGHLGHVFPDGPPPTGLRYCMNGLALTFVPRDGATLSRK
ncbi:peptide-methionine (R)-S-oxide reductase MsrB [Komagataeibacter intermedius]|uniref:peptide-methionine (R)-S-oxide reductase n=2 Tax=Komagataeibacter intermedius TaxID=66229 RepID=A0A0N1N7C3_9PROT|nr:peptide-methionine (R)-S-oxide reductase MsrB [Komagataeibacter intermedius]KPH89040.1 transcriptional regulator [Komagataeibacter intermedius AF2]MCF3635107.1 peptide-methionine (R)-S-oxide reductase MsrB [Komagataeibacter intermedius]GAN87628.1 peptide methionine sulfoxide reductase MsrB [Komagataeibacter intermedius TF2]GBQ66024.1 peptide methionine sulfoxide reductase [Komagataeibacter intermedius NRIC 0521]